MKGRTWLTHFCPGLSSPDLQLLPTERGLNKGAVELTRTVNRISIVSDARSSHGRGCWQTCRNSFPRATGMAWTSSDWPGVAQAWPPINAVFWLIDQQWSKFNRVAPLGVKEQLAVLMSEGFLSSPRTPMDNCQGEE